MYTLEEPFREAVFCAYPGQKIMGIDLLPFLTGLFHKMNFDGRSDPGSYM